MPTKKQLLSRTIEHIDITRHNVVGVVEAMQHMAFTGAQFGSSGGHLRPHAA